VRARRAATALAPPELLDGLEVASPEAAGLRPDVLGSLLDACAREAHRDLRSVLVARQNQLVFEAYFNGSDRETLHDIRSAAKTITGTLVGLALHDGRIPSLETPFLEFFQQYGPETATTAGKWKVSIRHLLEMTSGFDANEDDPQSPGSEDRMESTRDWVRFALDVPMAAPPGQRWAYASINTVLLGAIVSSVTGRDLEDWANEKLFAPLDFRPYRWRRGPQGEVAAQGNLSVRPRDLLKFGLLFLAEGRWRDRQLVPEGWIGDATHPRVELPRDQETGYAELYKGYAYHWWTGAEQVGPRMVPFYFASGNGGQRLFVIRDLDLVVVVTSSAYGLGRAHRRSHAILREILAAVVP
jgi:CubicO group peptidase (beta-lactamase class C family)